MALGLGARPMQSDAEFYLQRHGIRELLSDALSCLPAEPTEERALEALAAFFARTDAGTHVLGREFAFVNATTHNRRSFARLLVETLGPFDPCTLVSAEQLLDLVRLLCNDVPADVVHAAVDLASATSPGTQGQLPLASALLALCTRLIYSHFFARTVDIFHAVDTRGAGRVNRNVLCLTLRQMMALDSWTFDVPSERVVDELLLEPLCETPLDGGDGLSSGGAAELTLRQFEVRLFRATMAHAAPALGLGLAGGVASGGGASEEELQLHRRKAEIRERWARRRAVGAVKALPEHSRLQGQSKVQ